MKLTAPVCAFLLACVTAVSAADPWVVYEGKSGPGLGKHIVLLSGDDEYRSEEALPQLGKILALHHGFKCTVLFPIDPATGEIKPDFQTNVPGTVALKSADLMIIAARFRNLPDEQMAPLADYIESGRPIIAMRTATHSFNIPADKKYGKYSYNSSVWPGGFGKQVLGETWVSHHGHHGKESTRGLIAPGAAEHPILRGIKDGAIWGPTDVYGVTLPLPGDSHPLVLGQILTGMQPTDGPVKDARNEPMMPVAWTKTYKGTAGKTARIFTTTMGAATDLENAPLRRLLVNAAYWAVGLEDKISADSSVELVGEYHPASFSFGGHKKGLKPADFELR